MNRVAGLVQWLALVTIFGGCSGDRRGPPPDASSKVAAPTSLVAGPRIDHVDQLAREPMVVEHPSGTLFVSGYGPPRPMLWRSSDRGATWSRVDVGTEADGAIGNSDVDLAVGPDGTLYFITMLFDRAKSEGRHVVIGVSHDVGASWKWTTLSKTRFDDRPWVEVAPDGRVHVIWNDGSGVCYATSRDRGATWTEGPRIHDHGGSSHLAVGPKGEVAVRITPMSASGNKFDQGVDLIAVSSDSGVTWHRFPAPGKRDWAFPLGSPGLPRWVEPLAWDGKGRLYSLWTDSAGVSLARSTDQGETWLTWRLAGGGDVPFFPYLIARGDGELVASWFGAAGKVLRGHVARLKLVGNSGPRMLRAAPLELDSWGLDKGPGDPNENDSAGEYLAVTFLRDGGIGAVAPIQNERANRFGFSWWRLEVR